MKKYFLSFILAAVIFFPLFASAHQPRLVYLQNTGPVNVENPELSQAFYDELKGKPRDYFMESDRSFDLYLNLLVPSPENRDGRYSADIFLQKDGSEQKIASLDGQNSKWVDWWENFGRDWYLKGPEFERQVPAGKYRVQVYSADNKGKYVLAVGKIEKFDIPALLNVYWQLPTLKLTFFKTSVLQFFFTSFGIGLVGAIGIIIVLLLILGLIISLIKDAIMRRRSKTILLTSAGIAPIKDEVLKMLEKPAYDVTVAFINTAAKPEADIEYMRQDLVFMRELGFNIEEIDIEGKTEQQIMDLVAMKDLVYVEGGNTYYLLKAMRACNFGRIIRKLLKQGKVYVGASAGSIVAGKTIKTAGWGIADENSVGLKNLKGLGLVPFDVFVHYAPEDADMILKKTKKWWGGHEKLRIITDEQAIVVQNKEEFFIGSGEKITL